MEQRLQSISYQIFLGFLKFIIEFKKYGLYYFVRKL